MSAVQPYLATVRRLVQQRARGKTLHPCRPFGIDDAGFESCRFDPEQVLRAQSRNREARIVELMASEQSRRRQIHQPAIILIHQPPALDIDLPFLSRGMER